MVSHQSYDQVHLPQYLLPDSSTLHLSYILEISLVFDHQHCSKVVLLQDACFGLVLARIHRDNEFTKSIE